MVRNQLEHSEPKKEDVTWMVELIKNITEKIRANGIESLDSAEKILWEDIMQTVRVHFPIEGKGGKDFSIWDLTPEKREKYFKNHNKQG